MASCTLIIKDKKAKGKTQIILCFSYNSRRIKISTKESIEPEFWNPKKHRVIQTLEVPMHQEINNNLTLLCDRASLLYNEFLNDKQREPNIEELKIQFDRYLFTEELISIEKKQLTFFDYYREFIEIRKGNKKVGKQRLYMYENTLRLLRDFQYSTKELVAFETFNERFSVLFRKFLEEQMGYATNTIHKNFKVIRTVLNKAYTDNYSINKQYKSLDFMPDKEEVFDIALTINEVEALYKYDFSHNKRLERVRDLFIIGCYTGLRFSDFKRLGKEHLQGEYLRIVQEKTKKKNPLPVVIPVLKPVKEIFEKYDYKLPNDISNQKMNEYLKEMAKETKLFEEFVTYRRTRAGKSELVSNSKHQEITTHTARRTFCTMSYNLGVPTQAIMMISGHKTETSFLRYLKVTNEEHAKRTLKIWEAYYSNTENQAGKIVKLNQSAS